MATDAASVGDALARHNLSGVVTAYQGSKAGDGVIVFATEGDRGFVRFSTDGQFYSVMTDESSTVSGRVAKLFIASLFGEGELTAGLDRYDKILLGGLTAVAGCYDDDKKTACSYTGLDRAVAELTTLKTREAREADEARKREDAARTERIARQQRERMAQAIRRGDLIWEKGAALVQIVREQDQHPGGIDINEVEPIYTEYRRKIPTWRPTTLAEAERYRDLGIKILEKILQQKSTRDAIEERPDSGCVVKGSELNCAQVGIKVIIPESHRYYHAHKVERETYHLDRIEREGRDRDRERGGSRGVIDRGSSRW